MTHASRWRNRTRINCVQLEARTQPGSLLTSGIDLGAVAEVIAQPEVSMPRVIKKLDNDNTDLQIVGACADNHIVQTENVAAPEAAETKNQSTSGLGRENHIPAKANVNPLVNRPKDTPKTVQAINVQQYMESRNLELKSAPLQAAATHRPTMAFPGGQVSAQKMDHITVRTVDCTDTGSGNGSDGRILDGIVSQFTYSDNGGASSRVFGNAGGRGGANLGTQYITGSVDGDGLVQRIDSAGVCTAVAFDGGADPVQFNDVHATASGVVAVGTLDAAEDVGLLVRLDPTTLAVTAGVWGYSGAGLDVKMETTGVRLLSSNQQIFSSGSIYDQVGAVQYTFNTVADPTLTTLDILPQVNYTYLDIGTGTIPVNCETNGIDADRLGNSYLAIACDETGAGGGFTNVFARLNAAHSSTADLLYGVTLWDGGGFTATPGQGNLGARLLGGSSVSSGLRTVGAFDGTTFNPGVLSSLNVKWTDLSNPAGPTFAGNFWFIAGIDFYGEDVAIQRPVGAAPAQEYVATSIGIGGDHGAFVIEYYDGFAAFVAGYGFDAIGTEEIAYGVDTFSGAGNSDIYFAGTNDGDLGTGLNCDTTHNGGPEGFAVNEAQPDQSGKHNWVVPPPGTKIPAQTHGGTSIFYNDGPDTVIVQAGGDTPITIAKGEGPPIPYKAGQAVTVKLAAGGVKASGTFTFP